MYISLRAHLDRQHMDRRRFEAGHLKYACLKMAAQYPEAFTSSDVKVDCCVFDTK